MLAQPAATGLLVGPLKRPPRRIFADELAHPRQPRVDCIAADRAAVRVAAASGQQAQQQGAQHVALRRRLGAPRTRRFIALYAGDDEPDRVGLLGGGPRLWPPVLEPSLVDCRCLLHHPTQNRSLLTKCAPRTPVQSADRGRPFPFLSENALLGRQPNHISRCRRRRGYLDDSRRLEDTRVLNGVAPRPGLEHPGAVCRKYSLIETSAISEGRCRPRTISTC